LTSITIKSLLYTLVITSSKTFQ